MRTPACEMCDRTNTPLSNRGWCDICEAEFARVMETVRCVLAGGCNSPITCRAQRKCVQLKTAMILTTP